MDSLTVRLKAKARELGFDLVGVAPAGPPEHGSFFEEWIAREFAGEMAYLQRTAERRRDPGAVLPGARSVLCVAMNYNPGEPSPAGKARGRIARYARGDDYHDLLKDRLERLLRFAISESGHGAEGRSYVDTGPMLERDFAAMAGLGWFGKHTGLIHKRAGSWLLLGEILLNVALEYDTPVPDHCGTCSLCIEACPTGAILDPYVLDARKCISYLTIELRGPIPEALRDHVGNWVFGCDVCQEVCPWNREVQVSGETGFSPREALASPDLAGLLGMDQEAFSARFKGSPIKRTKRRGLLRNTAVALGNSGDRTAVPALAEALNDPEPLVRGHAAWALGKRGGEEARSALASALATEMDATVRGEIAGGLERLSDCGRL